MTALGSLMRPVATSAHWRSDRVGTKRMYRRSPGSVCPMPFHACPIGVRLARSSAEEDGAALSGRTYCWHAARHGESTTSDGARRHA
jgi:hypothetical protein